LRALICATLYMTGLSAVAQDQPAPKWEFYGGYSFVYPGTDVHGLLPGGVLPANSRLESNPRGAGASVTYDFNRWFGLTGDVSGQWGSGENGVPMRIDDAEFFNLSIGPKLTLRRRHFSPFLEALVGRNRLTSEVFGRDDHIGFLAGGGVDLNLGRHFAWRMIRADYLFSNHQYGAEATAPATDVRGVRLQSGIVFMFGGKQDRPLVSARCTVYPGETIAGEPATATAAASNFNAKHTLKYEWSTTGGQINGKAETAYINTKGLAGGNYTVTAHISDPAIRKNGEVSCMAPFSVKDVPRNPPSISCSADPARVLSGSPSTVSCSCSSPDNVPVTVSGWVASGGSISGAGNNRTLDTTGSIPGSITVRATCSDSRGLNTPATAMVLVENPPQPSAEFIAREGRLALHSVYFPTAQPRAAKPRGGLLASQQQILSSLAYDFKKYLEAKPDAHLTLEGHADPRSSVEYNQALSERRVETTKQFLIEHGVPAVSIETRAFGQQKNLTAAEVRAAVEQNPELNPEQRQRMLNNLRTILLASNRRVDVTLSTTGQKSVRQFPFNASDSLTLLDVQIKK
jgi:outer membrane protein OmpA-like peptidoglycan-associated protein